MTAWSTDEPALPDLTDEDVEAVLAGTGADRSDRRLTSFVDAVADVRAEYSGPAPHPARAAVTVARAAAIARSATPVATVVARDHRPRPLVRRFARLAGVTAAIVGTTGGLAWADTLPDPAQEVVARAAETIGIDLPAPNPEPEPAEAPPARLQRSDPAAPEQGGSGSAESNPRSPRGEHAPSRGTSASSNADGAPEAEAPPRGKVPPQAEAPAPDPTTTPSTTTPPTTGGPGQGRGKDSGEHPGQGTGKPEEKPPHPEQSNRTHG